MNYYYSTKWLLFGKIRFRILRRCHQFVTDGRAICDTPGSHALRADACYGMGCALFRLRLNTGACTDVSRHVSNLRSSRIPHPASRIVVAGIHWVFCYYVVMTERLGLPQSHSLPMVRLRMNQSSDLEILFIFRRMQHAKF